MVNTIVSPPFTVAGATTLASLAIDNTGSTRSTFAELLSVRVTPWPSRYDACAALVNVSPLTLAATSGTTATTRTTIWLSAASVPPVSGRL